jgi:hypothetical protein
MQEEVYPHFRDLMSQIVSLKDYFADEQVQAYLEELPNTGLSSEWTSPVGGVSPASVDDAPPLSRSFDANPTNSEMGEPKLSNYAPETPNRFQRSMPSVSERSPYPNANNGSGNLSRDLPNSRLPNNLQPTRNINEAIREIKRPSQSRVSSQAASSKRKFNVGRLVAVVAMAIALLGGSIWLVVWAFRSLSGSPRPEVLTLEKPLATLVQAIKENNSAPIAQPGPLEKETATKVIETWQTTKSKALGKTYEDNLLEEILIDPALSDWKGRAKELKASNSYLQYQIKSSEVDKVVADGDSKAKVVAKISESRNYFNNGELDRSASKDDASYTVEYDLVKKDNKWLIREMLVFN